MDTIFEQLYDTQKAMTQEIKGDFLRYKYAEIDWEERMFGLVGPRGVGKTTMLLQYADRHPEQDILYVQADDMVFSDITLLEFATRYVRQGGRVLFVDEVHKYKTWAQELKLIHDKLPDLRVAFTGSSVLDISKGQADLSRRAPLYHLQGLSFREFLALYKDIHVPALSLDDILAHRAELPVSHPYPLFDEYLHRGYYPFGQRRDYSLLLGQVIAYTLENDIPSFLDLSPSVGRKLKQLMTIIAKSVPFKPSMQTIAEAVKVSRNDVADYLMYIEQAGMISQVRDATGGIRGLGKVEKVYLDNTNLVYALASVNANTGNLRETFFYNQMRVRYDVVASRMADFDIDGRTFEIGGRKKGQRQVAGAAEGYVVKDDIEYGHGNVIPLWAFGLSY